MHDPKDLALAMAPVVREFVTAVTGPLLKRIEELEAREIPKALSADDIDQQVRFYLAANPPAAPMLTQDILDQMADLAKAAAITLEDVQPIIDDGVARAVADLPAPKDGSSVTLDDVRPVIEEAVKAAVADIPAPKDGASVTTEDVQPLIAEAIAKAVAELPRPKDGESVTTDDVRPMIEEAVKVAVSSIPTAKDGTSVTVEDVAPLIEEQVSKAVAAIPIPEKGKDADPEEVARLVAETVERAVAALPEPKDGQDADMEALAKQVDALVAEKMAEIPVPQDGKSVTVEDVEPVLAELVQRAVAEIPAPKDGVGLAGALIDRDGQLAVTLTNGETLQLGNVVGQDGIDGKNGDLGLGFDDMEVNLHEDGRTVVLSFARGDVRKAFEIGFPVVLDRGVFKDGQTYEPGDGVTWAGSWWIAQEKTESKPGTDPTWRLAVKRGRDGKDAK